VIQYSAINLDLTNDNTAATILDLLRNQEENRHHIQVMLETMAYRFPEEDNLKTPYDDALLIKIKSKSNQVH